METYIVTGIREETVADGSHRHIIEVCTQGGIRHTLEEVVDSIRAGDTWKTLGKGYPGEIQPLESCPYPGCTTSPYIATNDDPPTLVKQ